MRNSGVCFRRLRSIDFVLLHILISLGGTTSAFLSCRTSKLSKRFDSNCFRKICAPDSHVHGVFFASVPSPRTDDSVEDTKIDNPWRSCKSAFTAALVAGILAFSPSPSKPGFAFLPPPANAQILQASIPPGGPPPDVDAQKIASFQNEPGILDEAWTLIDKYYIDRTFNAQDWKSVRAKYSRLVAKNPKNEDNTMKLVAEMVKSLGDKYSRVLDANQYAGIQKYDLIGVGVTLMPNDKKEIIVGAPPVAGSASDEAGLKKGDYVVAINGLETKGRTAFDIIDQVSDDPNAEAITFTVRTQQPDDVPGEGYTRDITMKRIFQKVKNPVYYKISERRDDGTVVGYIRIFEFNSLVKGSVEEAITNLENEGANAFVLDLRGNPGGAFQSAVEMSSLFFEDRVATKVVDSNEIGLPFKTSTGRVMVEPDEPIAIWVDGGSASASEVFAGSLHDNCRALVMGEKSFGKGLIQAVYGLKNGAGLVLTVAKYVTPNGNEIQGAGITPDIPGKVARNIPGFSTDTSMVDFREISSKLDPSVCKVPQ